VKKKLSKTIFIVGSTRMAIASAWMKLHHGFWQWCLLTVMVASSMWGCTKSLDLESFSSQLRNASSL
jgi:hypothetical protein